MGWVRWKEEWDGKEKRVGVGKGGVGVEGGFLFRNSKVKAGFKPSGLSNWRLSSDFVE